MKVTDKYVLFWGSCFSQWYKSDFKDKNGLKFTSAEQFMMYHKAKLFNDNIIAEKIMLVHNVRKIKDLGREVNGFVKEIWDENSIPIVVLGNFYKFTQDQAIKKELLLYKSKEFVEASPKDDIWGIGLGEEDKRCLNKLEWLGENRLGQSITQVVQIIILNDIQKIKELENRFYE